ncbi:unnamed protein product [Callosobruchus maculatus]|uniref:Uncharacterized protein n=1 Tax=Callosobruchus maculatus TaxID=64391 RepID=A0A653BID6_CALMS|nr:unnamed protein product [Callosobruchus maculatus]
MDATILFQAAIPLSDGHRRPVSEICLFLRLNENELHHS